MLAAFVLLIKNDLVEDIMTNFTWWELIEWARRYNKKL
jgi:hypothetical protein